MLRIALLSSLLLFGCCAMADQDVLDPLAICRLDCGTGPHVTAVLENGSCECLCDEGYHRYNGYCYTQHDYEIFAQADCDSRCKSRISNSVGSWKAENCSCFCGRGYMMYNRTCITPERYAELVPNVCPAEKPVLKNYGWAYRGKGYYLSLCYENASAGNATEDRSTRRDYWNFVGDPYSNGSVSVVTERLMNISDEEGFSEYERVEFAIAFVQGLPYTYDNVSTPYDEYPRYPSETIYADGGDCEDTAILMAAILKKMGYDAVLLLLPRHLAAGVYCNPSDFDYNVTAYPYNGREYCYLETTGENWKVGVLPESHEGEEVEVVPLRESQPDLYIGSGRQKQFNYTYSYDRYHMRVNVTDIHVDNFGTETAKNVRINVGLEARDGSFWSQYTIRAGDIRSRGYYDAYVTNLNSPTGEDFRVSIAVSGDNFQPVESKGGWVTWN